MQAGDGQHMAHPHPAEGLPQFPGDTRTISQGKGFHQSNHLCRMPLQRRFHHCGQRTPQVIQALPPTLLTGHLHADALALGVEPAADTLQRHVTFVVEPARIAEIANPMQVAAELYHVSPGEVGKPPPGRYLDVALYRQGKITLLQLPGSKYKTQSLLFDPRLIAHHTGHLPLALIDELRDMVIRQLTYEPGLDRQVCGDYAEKQRNNQQLAAFSNGTRLSVRRAAQKPPPPERIAPDIGHL